MTPQQKVLADVVAERAYQDAKWGGAKSDATQTEADWVRYIREYAAGEGRGEKYDFRTRMVKAAALAVAAIEAHDAKKRG